MKNPHPNQRSKGFTLIELLVVITIIAVLAAMSFVGVNAALKKAKTTEGKVAAGSIAAAVRAFYTEYGRFPEAAGDSEEGVLRVVTDGSSSDFLNTLLGDSDDNPRSINFLSIKEGKNGIGGIVYNSSNEPTGIFQPFKNPDTGDPVPYTIFMSYDDPLKVSWGNGKDLRGEVVAVAAPGADGEEGTIDDITSFQR